MEVGFLFEVARGSFFLEEGLAIRLFWDVCSVIVCFCVAVPELFDSFEGDFRVLVERCAGGSDVFADACRSGTR